MGIIYYDLVNNYGLEFGSVEINFGCIMVIDMWLYCDEMVIVSKVGYVMWLGLYGNWGLWKSIIVSVD